MVTFGITLVVVGLAIYAISVIGAIIDGRSRAQDATAGPFEWWQWFWQELQKPIANLTKKGLKWFKRTVSLGTICLLLGVFFTIVGVASGDNDGDGKTPTTTVSTTTTA